jgi:hypothetical protein
MREFLKGCGVGAVIVAASLVLAACVVFLKNISPLLGGVFLGALVIVMVGIIYWHASK